MWKWIKGALASMWQRLGDCLSSIWAAIKIKFAGLWQFLRTGIDWTDVCVHIGVSTAITLIFGWFFAPWYGAVIACVLFYGREQAQQGDKNTPPVGWRKWVPLYWGPHGKAEFLPLIPITAGLAWCLSWFKATAVHLF